MDQAKREAERRYMDRSKRLETMKDYTRMEMFISNFAQIE
jgi:hypothetical protein